MRDWAAGGRMWTLGTQQEITSVVAGPGMGILRFTVATLLALALASSRTASAQDPATTPEVIPLTVPAGVPLHVVLEEPVRIEYVNVPVKAKVADPVYVFDHLVIPSGSQVFGRVVKVDSASRKQRGLAIANGNFSPIRKAHLDFDTLVLK